MEARVHVKANIERAQHAQAVVDVLPQVQDVLQVTLASALLLCLLL